ncbi:MAG TPA: acetyl-CoA decarbonylase/synthase complex subunit gamma [Anaerolineales bacterium]|nr:acetyl-CoA decarbonylase/synthase complex subunit gamma [Anaerolineales bacterium]
MALSGIQIYKMLPKTNCKECGFPTCLAFAMKLAAKQVELSSCPYVSEESKAELAESSAPPIRLVSIKSDGFEVKAGNETVMFRHEKTFYNRPGLFVRVKSSASLEAVKELVSRADKYSVNYVGMDLEVDGFALEADDENKFSDLVKTVRTITKRPLILIGRREALSAGLENINGESPLIYSATLENWEGMADLALKYKSSLAVSGETLDEISELTEKIKTKGFENIVLDLSSKSLGENLAKATQVRRLALKKNFRSLGFPTIFFANGDNGIDAIEAAQAIGKYSGFIVLNRFEPELFYPLLVLRQNIYTDPQKPIQVQPGIYEINSPNADSPVLVTTNFSITYFSVANEVEGSGLPAWLLVTDAEGMSVLTAWAAGKFDSERIAKSVKEFGVADKVTKKRIVLPGHVAVLSGEVEEELPGWEIRVGPREAVDIPSFMKQAL